MGDYTSPFEQTPIVTPIATPVEPDMDIPFPAPFYGGELPMIPEPVPTSVVPTPSPVECTDLLDLDSTDYSLIITLIDMLGLADSIEGTVRCSRWYPSRFYYV